MSSVEIVHGPLYEIAEYVAKLVPGVGCAAEFGDDFTTMGFVRDNALIGGIVFNRFRGHDVNATIGTEDPRWKTAATLHAVGDYVFNRLGCVRMTALTSSGNKAARAMLRRLGFAEEGVMRRGFDGRERLLIYGILDKEWKY